MMDSLFDLPPIYPSGFTLKKDFLSTAEEMNLIRLVQQHNLKPFMFHGYQGKRKTRSFGYDYQFEQKKLSEGAPIPPEFNPLIEKAAEYADVLPRDFCELLLTEYPIGSVINWHRDAFAFGIIAGISLGADCIFRLRPHNKEKRSRKTTISIELPRRSIYVITGEARLDWEHATAPVTEVRYSVTLRTLRKLQK